MPVLCALQPDLIKISAMQAHRQSALQEMRVKLAIHSVGGVVTSAQPLMIVVPESTNVTAEVSIANQKNGSYYPAALTLARKDMLIEGKRRIIEHLLSPVQRAGSESLRER